MIFLGYFNNLARRRDFSPHLELPIISKTVLYSVIRDGFFQQNNAKNLDLSCKTDLYFRVV